MYALGRNVQYFDRPAIRTIVRDAAAHDYTFAALVRGIVSSVPFRNRLAPAGAEQAAARATGAEMEE
jgi:hypothetical protein